MSAERGIAILDVIAKRSPYSQQLHYYVVLDRMPVNIYQRDGSSLVAHDDGLYDFLAIEPRSRDAFGGREFDIQLTDGNTYHCAGQVWSVAPPKNIEPTVSVGIGTLEKLRKCYVFCGASVAVSKLEAWLANNTPSTNYRKHDPQFSLEWLESTHRKWGRVVCGQRARKLRSRGVTLWRDASGQRTWSPRFESRKREFLEAVASDPGSVRLGGAA